MWKANAESKVPSVSTIEQIQQWWGLTSAAAAQQLAEGCAAFGVNPDPACQPMELLAVRDVGDEVAPAVRLVTAGGRRLRWPMDLESEHQLRYQVFKAYDVNKATGAITELPLPRDLTLP